jgi:ribosomal-protein-alanine N-acetyltransferase
VLAAVLKKGGELIGDIGISKVDCETNGLEIGYVVSEQYRGRGYATELVVAMTKFAASTFGAKVLYGRVIRGNDASSRVLEKSGFKFVKEELYADDDPYGNGMLVYEYRIG